MNFGIEDKLNNTIGGIPIEVIKEAIAQIIEKGE